LLQLTITPLTTIALKYLMAENISIFSQTLKQLGILAKNNLWFQPKLKIIRHFG
jgi:hypothetical protein